MKIAMAGSYVLSFNVRVPRGQLPLLLLPSSLRIHHASSHCEHLERGNLLSLVERLEHFGGILKQLHTSRQPFCM
jgi:hypothetical protein